LGVLLALSADHRRIRGEDCPEAGLRDNRRPIPGEMSVMLGAFSEDDTIVREYSPGRLVGARLVGRER